MKNFTISLATTFLFLFFSPAKAQNHALNFDGVNDRIIVPSHSNYDFDYGTVEAWVRPQGLVGNTCIIANRSYGGTRFSFHMSPTQIGLYNGSQFGPINYSSTEGVWYHLAFVCTPYSTEIYVNGNYVGQTSVVIRGNEYYDFEYSGITGQELSIGSVRDNGGTYEHFKGDIDDVRIWNVVRNQSEINSDKNSTLNGSEWGLVALFNFDQGLAGGNNAGLTIVTESVDFNDGTMQNFSLSGTSSNWVARNTTLPVSLGDFKAAKQNNTVSLQWYTVTEHNSQSFVIERSTDGKHFNAIGSLKAAGNSNARKAYAFEDASPLKGNNYYRLKQVDADGKSAYSEIRLVSFAALLKLTWYTQGNNAVVQLPGGKDEHYSVTDMNGAIAMQGRLENGKLVIANKSAGVYNVRVLTSAGVTSIKIVLQ